jgi:hypothetical protein
MQPFLIPTKPTNQVDSADAENDSPLIDYDLKHKEIFLVTPR